MLRVVALSSVRWSDPTELLFSASWFQEHRDCSAEWSSSLAAKTVCRQGSRIASVSDPSLERPVISSSTALAEEQISSLLWARLETFPKKLKNAAFRKCFWCLTAKRSISVQHYAKYHIIHVSSKDPGCVQVRSHLEEQCRGKNAAAGRPDSAGTAWMLLSRDSASAGPSHPRPGPPPLGPFLFPVWEQRVLLRNSFVALTPWDWVTYWCCFWPHSKWGLAVKPKPPNSVNGFHE